jgi:hypothetical protein
MNNQSRTTFRAILWRKAVSLAAIGYGSAAGLIVGLVLVACGSPAEPNTRADTVEATTATPAPTTISGYRAMFAGLDEWTWGSADIGISIRLYDGRRVWLYGDTFSNRYGMVRSTAITQTGGDLRVSNAGRQLFPTEQLDDGRTQLYWPEKVQRQTDGDLTVTTAPVAAGSENMWDLERHPTQSRLAELGVDADGDVHFKRWLRWVDRPAVDLSNVTLRPYEPGNPAHNGHWLYWDATHDIQLADGTWLKTTSQNWELPADGDPFRDHRRASDGSIRYDDWDIEFSSVATR